MENLNNHHEPYNGGDPHQNSYSPNDMATDEDAIERKKVSLINSYT